VILSAILVLGFLVAVTALYVAAELSVVAVRRSQVRQLAEEGHWLARRLLPLVEQPVELDRAIAASQIGITVSSLVLGAYGQATLGPALAPLFERLGGWNEAAAHSAAAVAVLIALTLLHMILGELLPKSIALEFPTQTSLLTVLPLAWSLRLFSPLVYLFNGSGLLLLKLLRVRATRHHHVHSPGEIDLLLTESSSDGDLDVEDRRRLRRALRLGARRARDLMIPRAQIIAIDQSAPVAEVLGLVASSPFTRFPVYRGTLDRVVGVLHTKDVLLRQMETGTTPRTISDLVRPVVTVPAHAGADQVLVLLRERRVQLALVVGEAGAMVGLITLEDVLSEVFGAFTDELKGEARRRRAR
jgi:CBS domain containing-hemolysin-like protein